MNALLKQETPKAAARRLAAPALRDGFEPARLHEYRDAQGLPWVYRIRLKHPATGEKWIRPMRFDGARFVIGEPPTPPNGKPLYLLPELLGADLAAPICIVEGETCADALARLGLIATTSGSSDSVNTADWQPLRDRTCILWRDCDAAGKKWCAELAPLLHALGCTVEALDVAALDLPEKGDCVDWLGSHPDATDADVLALGREPTAIETMHERTSAPEPLRRPLPPPELYPMAELGPILAPACASLRRVIQASDAVCGASLLAAASLAVQGLADVHHDGRVHPLSLWFLTVAESGERKSAVDSEAMRPAREYEKALAADYTAACDSHSIELEDWGARREKAKADTKGGKGSLVDALRIIGPEPLPPLRPTVIAADFTAEGLAKLLAAGRPSIGAFTDEAALVFGGHGMTKESVARTAGTLCKLWDNGSLDRVRAGDGPMKLWGRRLALHLMAQPVIAERALSDDVLAGQGFLARALLAWPESTAGTRPYCSENLQTDPALYRYATCISALLSEPLPLIDGARNELLPRPLHLAPEAARAWRDLHDAVERGMAPAGRFATVKPWASKTPEQCLRIAGVLTLLDDSRAQAIQPAAIERAAELALWHLNEAVRLAGTAALSPEVRDAEALLLWCHATGRTLLHSGDALRLGPVRIREAQHYRQAVRELEQAGWAHPINGGATIKGRHHRFVWRIVEES